MNPSASQTFGATPSSFGFQQSQYNIGVRVRAVTPPQEDTEERKVGIKERNHIASLELTGLEVLLRSMTRKEIRAHSFTTWWDLPDCLYKPKTQLDVLCPRLVSELEELFQSWSDSHRREQVIRVAGLPLPLALGIAVISCVSFDAIFDSAYRQKNWMAENVILVLLCIFMLSWSLVFKLTDSDNDLSRQRKMDRGFHFVTEFSMLLWTIYFTIYPAIEGDMTKHLLFLARWLVSSLIILFVPITFSLSVYLSLFLFGYICWVTAFCVHFWNWNGNQNTIYYHCLWMLLGFCFVFIVFRAGGLSDRLAFLRAMKLRMTNHILEDLSHLARKSMKEGTLKTLLRDLEDPEMKQRLQLTHQGLVEQYVKLSQIHVDEAAQHAKKLQSDYNHLNGMCKVERDRLKEVLNNIYKNFLKLPEWEAAKMLPDFDDFVKSEEFPNEKIHQRSRCRWWPSDLEDVTVPPVLESVGLEHDQVGWYIQRATWAQEHLRWIMRKVVRNFNEAKFPEDLGLDPDHVFSEWNAKHPDNVLNDKPFQSCKPLVQNHLTMSDALASQYIEHGANCGLQWGPLKDRVRAEAKVFEYQEEALKDPEGYPDSKCFPKYVCDWVRGRVLFANPETLAVFFWYLMYSVPQVRVVRGKNKLVVPPDKGTKLDVHLNVCFDVQGEEHCAELQLLLEGILLARDLEHKCYTFRRSARLGDMLAPVWEVLPPFSIRSDNSGFETQCSLISTCMLNTATNARTGVSDGSSDDKKKTDRGSILSSKFQVPKSQLPTVKERSDSKGSKASKPQLPIVNGKCDSEKPSSVPDQPPRLHGVISEKSSGSSAPLVLIKPGTTSRPSLHTVSNIATPPPAKDACKSVHFTRDTE
eukprot:gnl/MRDRNA2_/MRDRNA2_136487_c0_seq1.p1 gnl/MRDRNA2_/MRDRNA2_136487_c0~~gnl/MRDRNA2_/MRDRNA2_136487_c0_seq1.p1  ORF type:complete len:863 (+),score=111.87 gnl/MRDRNA2_/MRDRNA2_136487_c0_seq1:186-2774(+)